MTLPYDRGVGRRHQATTEADTATIRTNNRPTLIRRLSIASLVGQLVWIAIIVVAGLVEPGYSEIRDPVSALGAGTAARPWLFNVGVTIWGASFIAAAWALALDAPRGLRGSLGPALIALTGLAQILDGFPFPADCRPAIDAGCRARELAGDLSWRDAAHGWAYFTGAGALLLSVIAMAWRLHGDRRWGRSGALALGAGLVGIALFAVLFFATGNGADDHYELAQRVALAAGGGWVAALTTGLLAIYGQSHHRAVRAVAWIRGNLPGGRLLVRPGSGAG